MNTETAILAGPAESRSDAKTSIFTQAREDVLGILNHCQGFWRDRLRLQTPLLHEDNTPFSGRFLADLALGFLALARAGQQDAIAPVHDLLAGLASAQHPSGAFHWLLPDPGAPADGKGVPDQVDLAMVMDLLRHCHESEFAGLETQSLCREVSKKAIGFLRRSERPSYPGTIRKRDYGAGNDTGIDILNGDAMAIKAFFCAARIHHDPSAREDAQRFALHLQERFGRHATGWWPYSECLKTGRVLPPGRDGRSVFFQSMMVVHLRECLPWLNLSGMDEVLQDATRAVARFVAIDGGIDDNAESRQEFVGKPNLLVCDCLASGENPHAIKAFSRLSYIRRSLLRPGGDVVSFSGNPLPDMWKVWVFSDAARMFLRLENPLREVSEPVVKSNL